MTDEVRPDRLPHIAASIGADYADSFSACRELLSAMFDLEAPSDEVRAAYTMDFALFDYGPVKLGMSLTSAAIMVRDPRTIARTGMDQFHVQFYRNHGYVLTIDGAEREVRPGDVGLLDLTRPVTIRTDGIDNLSVIIERTLLLPLLNNPSDFHGLVLSRDSEAGIGVREHLEEMWRLGPELTVAQGHEWSRATADLIAARANGHAEAPATTRTELRQIQFRAISRRIERHIHDPDLGPEVLAHQFFITRPTLYRMFEPHGGIGRYILQRRLAGVFRDLSDPTRPEDRIADVFSRWGLDSHTAAGRAFRAAWGMTPSECRARALELRRTGGKAGAPTFEITPDLPAKVRAFR